MFRQFCGRQVKRLQGGRKSEKSEILIVDGVVAVSMIFMGFSF
jgi:hypothetical protein